MTAGSISLSLSREEALVFFEWLSRTDNDEDLDFDHSSEQAVLWLLHAQLESTLTEPFDADYAELVDQARRRVKAERG
ncbi:MAG: hypothetical protein AAFY08_09205 [Planctomycetota bacterium]